MATAARREESLLRARPVPTGQGPPFRKGNPRGPMARSRTAVALALVWLCLLAPAAAQPTYPVRFEFRPPGPARQVFLVGSFNQWDPEAHPMEERDGLWILEVELPAGRYAYKFLVDGQTWYPDPRAEESEEDGFGGRNSVIRVQPSSPRAAPALFHGRGILYRNPLPSGELRLRLRLAPELKGRGAVLVTRSGAEHPLDFRWSDGAYRYGEVLLQGTFLEYRFRLGDLWYGPRGTGSEAPEVGWFRAANTARFTTPDWVPRAVFYQIFPDRFANGDPANDPPRTLAWGGKPTSDSFFGGDLQGILDHLDYLESLGVGALYLNPIFKAPSNHKYDTEDYRRVDPAFGDEALLRGLVRRCHERGIRVILDGVFNHSGTGFAPFRDLEEKGERSLYADWFFVKSFPIRRKPKPSYRCWWGYASLPKLNTRNSRVREYLLEVATRWIRIAGIDGWRLDVPNEVPHDFWREFRRRVKAVHPDAYLTGELWYDASRWLQGDQFDGVMNYRFRDAVLDFLVRREIDGRAFLERVQQYLLAYPEQTHGCLLNLLGSHDTERILTLCQGDRDTVKLARVLQFTLPGTPMIYYGDEVGLEGGGDPDCRRCMPWDPASWDRELLEQLRRLSRLRGRLPALQVGQFRPLPSPGRTVAFERVLGEQRVLVAINAGSSPVRLDLAGWKGVLAPGESLVDSLP